jgi:hypothetical protein
MAANNFTGTVNSNWNNTGNWSLGAVPTAGDGNVATFTGTSPACTVDGANRVCNNIDFTNYTNTITFTFSITVSGNITLGTGMAFAGAGFLAVNAAGTLTSNGKTCGVEFRFTSNATYTLADNWQVPTLTLPANTLYTVNGFTMSISGSITASVTTLAGTTNLVYNGTGTWSGATAIKNNLTINTAGTLTISGAVNYNTGTLTYTAGTVVTAGSTLTIALSTTLNLSGMDGTTTNKWVNITISGALTLTLSSNLYCSGTFSNTGNNTIYSGFTIYCGGSFTWSNSSQAVVGNTTAFILNGTGTWSGAGNVSNDLTINTAGTITITTANYRYKTLTYTAGTVTSTGSVLNINGDCTLNISGITFLGQLNFTATETITLSSNINTGSGSTFISNSNAITVTLNGFTINIGGSLGNGAAGANSPIFTGTSNFVMNGTGNLGNAISNPTGLIIKNNITINTAGTITLLGYVRFSTGTFTYTSGTIDATTNTSTLQLDGSSTLATNGMSWYNVSTITALQTVTLSSNLSITNNLALSTFSTTFAGTGVWTCANFIIGAGGSALSHTLVSTQTYTITTSISITGTSALHHTIKSSVGGSKAILILQNNSGVTQDIDFCNGTDIDSSLGLTIWTYKGTVTTCSNWFVMPTQGQSMSISY